MDNNTTLWGAMRLDLRLSPETAGRLVKVTVRSLPDTGATPRPGARWRARDAIPAFVTAVDAGLFRGPKEEQRAEILRADARTQDGARIDEWEIMTPPLAVDAFASLSRMFGTAGARAVAMVQNAPEARLTVRAFEQVPPTDRPVPWTVENHTDDDAKDAIVIVCFEHDAPPEIVRETQATLRAWAAIAALGGFAGSGMSTSAAVLAEVGTELESEVFASFEALNVGREAWPALWNGLSRIHRHAPIARVERR